MNQPSGSLGGNYQDTINSGGHITKTENKGVAWRKNNVYAGTDVVGQRKIPEFGLFSINGHETLRLPSGQMMAKPKTDIERDVFRNILDNEKLTLGKKSQVISHYDLYDRDATKAVLSSTGTEEQVKKLMAEGHSFSDAIGVAKENIDRNSELAASLYDSGYMSPDLVGNVSNKFSYDFEIIHDL